MFCLFFISCVTAPKASVTLSEELTGMIISAKESHLEMIGEYFNEKQLKIDNYIEDKVVPKFMKKFREDSKITDLLKKIKTQNEKDKLLEEFSSDAAIEIFKLRKEMVDSLYEVEYTFKEKVERYYSDMLAVNQTLIAHLISVSKVTKTRKELLKQLKLPIEKLVPLEKINSKMGDLLKFKGDVKETYKFFDEMKAIIEE